MFIAVGIQSYITKDDNLKIICYYNGTKHSLYCCLRFNKCRKLDTSAGRPSDNRPCPLSNNITRVENIGSYSDFKCNNRNIFILLTL